MAKLSAANRIQARVPVGRRGGGRRGREGV